MWGRGKGNVEKLKTRDVENNPLKIPCKGLNEYCIF